MNCERSVLRLPVLAGLVAAAAWVFSGAALADEHEHHGDGHDHTRHLQRRTFHLEDYFPLGAGNEWSFETIVHGRGYVYQRSEDTWKAGRCGIVQSRMAAKAGKDPDSLVPDDLAPRIYLSRDEHGLHVWGHDFGECCATPRLTLPPVVHYGTDRETRTCVFGPERGRRFHCELEVESCDRVMTLAGPFTDCLRVGLVVKERGREWPELLHWRLWLAKDVGPVFATLDCEGYPASRGPVKVQERLIRAKVGGLKIEPRLAEPTKVAKNPPKAPVADKPK